MYRLLFLGLFLPFLLLANNECLSCHKGIEDIRDPKSKMMQEIFKVADKAGVPKNDCVVCHGGNPEATVKEKAHDGTLAYFKENKGQKHFILHQESPWINENTCGMCHPKQIKSQWNNLMATEAGKIHGALWGFGAKDGYDHNHSNFGNKDVHERIGTKVYDKYMQELRTTEPQGFPKRDA